MLDYINKKRFYIQVLPKIVSDNYVIIFFNYPLIKNGIFRSYSQHLILYFLKENLICIYNEQHKNIVYNYLRIPGVFQSL